MTSSPDDGTGRDQDGTLRDAIQWHVRMTEEPEDDALRRAFRHWLASDPAHAAAWQQAERVMGLLAQGKSVAFLPPRTAPPSAPRDAISPRRRRRLGLAAVAAAALLVVAMTPQAVLRLRADHVTGTAEQQVLALEDGSRIRLAPGSAVRVRYAGDRRTVDLMAGEAFFEVSRNPDRPFTVTAGAAHVTVLGTGFNVRLGTGGADVAVRHGSVQVDRDGDTGGEAVSTTLAAGQWARLPWAGPAVRGTGAPANVGAWSAQRLVAVAQPLSEVIADLRRYYPGAIVLTDPELGGRIVTGSYDVRDPVRAVETITGPLGGKVRRVTPWLLVVSAS
ncbi:FecR family protein [Niveispirillum fermenti]|uniref:FecR family protein n=1 Tax=Niveispirillum fermenti TaxID=1233113 RepID=UPI003A8A7DCA